MRQGLLFAVALLSAAPHHGAHAQVALPAGYGGLIACGGFWLVAQPDSTVRVRHAENGKCGRAEVRVTVASVESDSVMLSVRARSPREALRLPLRFIIDAESVVVYRHGTKEPAYFARLRQWVRGGDVPNQSSLEVLDGWRMRMWRLSDSPPDSTRVVVLAPGELTFARTISLTIGAADERADSLFVPFLLQGQHPAPLIPSRPPLFDPSIHLRDVPIVTDSALFPTPFYDGIAVIRFGQRAGTLTRQLVMDRLQGRVLAVRPGPAGEPDFIVQVGAAWRDSLKQRAPLRRLSREVRRFGYLLRAEDSAFVLPVRTPVDTTVVDLHYDEECQLPADRESRRRLAMIFTDATPEERQAIARFFGARWRNDLGDSTNFFTRLEMVGTRDEVQRQLGFMRRLPETDGGILNGYWSQSGRVCP